MRAGDRPAGAVASYWKLAAGLGDPQRARLLLEIGQGMPLVWEAGDPEGDRAAVAYLNSRIWSIAGGSNEMQRNAISEQALGLPREPSVERGKPFREVVRDAGRWAQS
jgi:alkylation response protein AidB-like acyl-CoA dehydrogenase